MAAVPANVILVPGFGGTTLSYPGGRGGYTSLWYNPKALVSNNPLAGALATDGSSPYPLAGKVLTPRGPVNLAVYQPMLAAIAAAGYVPTFWGYDWRLSPTALATSLATFLQSGAVAESFQVVCHSFGGLIAQLAYPAFQLLASGKTWAQTVYSGTPHGGSYWAAAALAGWFPHGSELAALKYVFDLATPIPQVKSPIFSQLQGLLGELVGSWPGLYALLPNFVGPWASLDTNALPLSLGPTYENTPGGQQSQWFVAAVALFNTLVANLKTPRAKETCIYGTGSPTLGTYKAGDGDPSLLGSYGTLDGDGTVTAGRAVLPAPAVTVQLQGIGHNGLMTSGEGAEAVTSALTMPPTANTTIPFDPPPFVPPPAGQLLPYQPIVRNPFANTHSDP